MVTQKFSLVRLFRPLLAVAFQLALVLGVAHAPAVQAAFHSCRADPLFLMSDGTILDVSVSIGTDVANVEEIHYTVHGPKGVKLLAAISTPTLGFDGLETVTYIADAAPNQYITDALVHVTGDAVPTTSYTVFAGNSLLLLKLRLSAQYREIVAWSGQHMIAYLSK